MARARALEAAVLFGHLRGRRFDTRSLFETYCSPCHGLGATGDGRVAQKFQTPPNLTSLKYARLADGYFFWVMSHGVRIMPPYFENTTPRERWMIVTRLRSLQEQ